MGVKRLGLRGKCEVGQLAANGARSEAGEKRRTRRSKTVCSCSEPKSVCTLEYGCLQIQATRQEENIVIVL